MLPVLTLPAGATLRRRALLAVLALLLAMASCLLTAPTPAAHADDKDDKIQRKQEVDRQLDDIRGDLYDVNQDLGDTYLALAQTELEIPGAQQDLEDAQREADDARRADEDMGRRLTDAQSELDRLEGEVQTGQDEVDRSDEDMKRLSLAAYKGDGIPSAASVYLGSADPQDAVDRSMNYTLTLETQGTALQGLRTDQALTTNSADRIGAVRQEVADLKAQAEETLQAKIDAEGRAQQAKDDLDALYQQQTQQKADLEAKKTQYEGQETDLSTESDGLDQEIDELTRQEQEAAARGKPETTVPDNGGAPGVSARGFMRPVGGTMNSTFGWRFHPVYHKRMQHKGDDFPVACGTPVRAAQDGKVIATTSNGRAGNKLIISHGVLDGKVITTSYHHLSSFKVSVGQTVHRGDIVAASGTTGASTGCHLHFEVHENGTAVDPKLYV